MPNLYPLARLLFVGLWLVGIPVAHAQVPAFDFAMVCGGTVASQSQVKATVSDKAGNLYLTGIFRGSITLGASTLTAVGDYDVFVAKLDTAGTYLWAAQAGGDAWDIAQGLAVDASGNVHVTGYCIGNSARFGPLSLFNPRPANLFEGSGYNLFVGTLSATGTWQRVVRVGGVDINNYVIGTSLAVDAQGNAYVAGGFRGREVDFGSIRLVNEGVYNVFVACLAPNGTWRWAVNGGGRGGHDFVNGVAVDGRGGVLLTGIFSSTAFRLGGITLPYQGFGDDAFVAKLSSSTGSWQWAVRVGSLQNDRGSAIAVDGRGDAYLTGSLGGSQATAGRMALAKSTPDLDLLVAKFDGLTGDCRWAVRGGGIEADGGSSIAVDEDGTSYVAGNFAGTAEFGQTQLRSAGNTDAVTASLDAAGQWRWALGSGGAGDDYATAVAAGGRRSAYVAGTFEGQNASFGPIALQSGEASSPHFSHRGFVARVSDHALRSRADELTLWPNPLRRGATVWAAGLATGQPVHVFDATGRLVVADARPAYQAQGLTLPTSLPPGLYVVRCGQQTRRLVVD